MIKPGELFQKNRREVLYIITGAITTFVDWAVYGLCFYIFKIGNTPSNVAAWTAAVIFAFIANKVMVFKSMSWKAGIWVKEFAGFVSGRIVTGALEVLSMWLLVDRMGLNAAFMKILTGVLIIILNYISGRIIFRRNGKKI